ncbi:MAG: hypothetical protein H6Q10_3513 [Acidobacteria bacterium]|nr:hypothetical protein [Acidobacteriota bacterium]
MNPAAGARIVLRHELTRVALALSAITAVFTFPLAARITDALPGDLGDPLLNCFILAWGASRMPFAFSGVWTAPFYFPLKDTLALSEHLIGITVFTAPVQWTTGNQVLAHNVAFLGSYVLAGVGMYLLARALWGRKDAAFLAALAFAFAPHRVMHIPHLQVLFSGWMPIGLWGLHRYFQNGSWRALGVFAGAYALLALSNGYFLYFFAVPVAVVVAGGLIRASVVARGPRRLRVPWREFAALGAAAAAVLGAITPVAIAYLRVRESYGFRRSPGEIAAFSAVWSDYVRIPPSLWAWSGVLTVGEGERMLFPGVTIVVLAAMALAGCRRGAPAHPAPSPAWWRWNTGLYLAILALAVWLSFGPAVPGPYDVMLAVLPGLDGLRVPARFVAVAALALGVLGAGGATWLLSRLRPRAALAAAAVLGAAITIEGYGGPMYLEPFRHDQPARGQLNAWMRSGPPGGVLELPVAGPEFEPFTLVYQYNALLHRHAVVNGYSGYGYALQDFLAGPGSPVNEADALPGLIDGLRAIGVRYLVLNQPTYAGRPELGWPDPTRLADLLNGAAGTDGRRFNSAVAWRLADPRPPLPVDERALRLVGAEEMRVAASAMPDRVRFAFDGNLDTKWLTGAPQSGAEWLRIAFDREVDVGRLVVETSRFGVGDYPRSLVVESETADGSAQPGRGVGDGRRQPRPARFGLLPAGLDPGPGIRPGRVSRSN